ncbi:MAG: DUF3298 and DUF4163 domain-containing protein [Victivallaceae bacterium]|nr:DUF3298 and DUF4163 domain-containing protein [Victivallaceae bacterium]
MKRIALVFAALLPVLPLAGKEEKEDDFVRALRIDAVVKKDFCRSAELLAGLYDETEKKVVYADDQIVSFRIDRAGYTGGAHDWHNIEVGTLDRKSGKRLTLDDVAPGEKRALLTKEIKSALMKILEVSSEEKLMQRLQAEPLPTENFYLDGNFLHMIYNEYEIAPYSEGNFDVRIPWRFR